MGQKASVPQPGTTIQVIGAGLSRTGTSSFGVALEILLDGPVYHGGTQATMGLPIEIKSLIEILRRWLAGGESNRHIVLKLLQHRLDGFAAITDAPGSQLVPELLELYPDAKVICTVRDLDSWEKSLEQISNVSIIWFLRPILLPLPGMRHFVDFITLIRLQWDKLYGKGTPIRQMYHLHVAWLKEVVPEDRLVFFNVKDGWEPLCKALGKDVPDQPFPHINDSEAVDKIVRFHIRRGLTRWALILAVGAVAAAWVFR